MNKSKVIVACLAVLVMATVAVAQQRAGLVGPPTVAPTGQVSPYIAEQFIGSTGYDGKAGSFLGPSATSSLTIDMPVFDRVFMMTQNDGQNPQSCVVLSSSNSYTEIAMLSDPLYTRDGVFQVFISGQASIANTANAGQQKAVRVECKVFDLDGLGDPANEVADCWGVTGPASVAGNFVRSNNNDTSHQLYGAYTGYAETGAAGVYRIRIRTFTNNWLGTFCYGNLAVYYNAEYPNGQPR